MERNEFERLVAELQGPLFNHALRKLQPDDALDIVSETFLTVWQKRAEMPQDPDGQRAWCWRVAQYKIMHAQQTKRRKHHDSRFAEDYIHKEPTADDPAVVVLGADTAARMLRSLPPGERDAVTAVASSDLSGSELAAMLGVSQSAFASRLSRGREKIAQFFRNDELILEGE